MKRNRTGFRKDDLGPGPTLSVERQPNYTARPAIINHSFYGLKVSQFREADLRRLLVETVRSGGKMVCYGYSLTILPRLRSMPQIYTVSESCDLMVADGKGLYWLCRWFGVPLECDWAIYELTDALLEIADQNKFSVMLLGTDPEHNRIASENLRSRYENALICPGIDGFYGPEEENSVVDRINHENPDILMIGMSSPKKEEFLGRNRHRLQARIIVLMGGVIDIYSGRTRPIPRIVKNLCLTWVYRFAQEPARTKQILWGGLDVLFRLLPALAWARWIRGDQSFSIPAFYGVSCSPNGGPHGLDAGA